MKKLREINTCSTQYKNLCKWVEKITDGELGLRVAWDNICGGSHQLDRVNPLKGEKRRYINAITHKEVRKDTLRFIKEEMCKIRLSSELKFSEADWYKDGDDCRDLKSNFMKMDGKNPIYVNFNDEPYLYEKALVDAYKELCVLFKDCNNYKDARNLILSLDNTLSRKKGYCVSTESTGNYYGDMVFLYGDELTKTIYWSVRWY